LKLGVPLPLDKARGRVGLPPGSAVRLVAGPRREPSAGVGRQFALAHPPVHL